MADDEIIKREKGPKMLIHWIWLATRPDLNDRDKLAILTHFRDPEDIFYAEPEAFKEIDGLTVKGADALQDKDLHSAGAILRECMDKNIHICTYYDGAYPGRLKNIADPPLVLYYKGHLPDLDGSPVIAVVGTRKATVYGVTTARKIGGQIARSGGIIVSGMAEGIDKAAITGALTSDGSTVGVLGCGVDRVYPTSNRSLYRDVEQYGCLISEFPPGTPPYRWNFPKRNRIMSGLSNGVLVVEAPERSGALITARQAAEQGRDVFVVPGNVDMPTCEGSNALLREGAISVTDGYQVVSEYLNLYPDKIRPDRDLETKTHTGLIENMPLKVAQKPCSPEKKPAFDRKKEKITIDNAVKQPYIDIRDASKELNEDEQKIVDVLRSGECLVDDVIARTGLPAGVVLSTLTMLEIDGIVERLPGKRAALK